MRRGFGRLVVAILAGAAVPAPAFAYRPFDSTDPAVAEPGEYEIELSPLSVRRDDVGDTLIAPQLRLNYGFARDWEIVLEGQGEHPQYSGARRAFLDNALSLKYVAREGSLQGWVGPSAALELGALLPDWHGEPGAGAALAAIIGEVWSWGAIHFNAAAELSRGQRAEMFLGTIFEGPNTWKIRPVAEIVYQREFGIGEQTSILGGFIWQVKDTLAFDVAVRQASVGGSPETEIRAGVTFAFSSR